MFAKLSLIVALAFAPWAHALLLQLPVGWKSSSVVNITWTNAPSDPPFTLQLTNSVFHDTFGIANNLNPSADFASFELGVVPQSDQYTLRAINVTDGNQIYDETPAFFIQGPPATSSGVSTSSSASSSAAASGSSGASQASSTLTVPANSQTSTTGFGVTNSNTASTATGASNSNAAASGTSSSSSPASTNFNNGAASFPRLAPLAVAALALVAGAAVAL